MSEKYFDAIIVGAGSSGLALAFHLLKKNVSLLVLDGAGEIGSSWYSRHPQLKLNTHRWLSNLPGRMRLRGSADFVSKEDYIAYLRAYSEWLITDQGLELKKNSLVTKLYHEGEGWRVITDSEEFNCAHVVIATGPDRVPNIPEWNGLNDYRGQLKHAATFGAIEQYDGKRVLIVGGANSGIDIANHLVKRGKHQALSISMRSGTHLMPTYILGVPVQLTSPLMTLMPLTWQDRLIALFSKICFGDLRQYGVKTPELGVATRLDREGVAPGFDNGFVSALKKGLIKILPEIDSFSDQRVRFVDGRQQAFDEIICATGYGPGLDRFLQHNVLNHSRQAVQESGLWIFGMKPKLEGSLHARKRESRVVANAIVNAVSEQTIVS